MLDRNIILVGYSGHGLVVADAALENNARLVGYSENSVNDFNPYQLQYFGNESSPDFNAWNLDVDFLLGIGDNKIREKIYNLIIHKGKKAVSIIHPTSSISNYAKLGKGVFCNRNVIVNAFANIGNNVVLNSGCIIEHECEIQDHVHIAPGVVLAGNVTVGQRTFVGANSVIKQGVIIGRDVIIGAGSVILKSVPDGRKIVGNPGRIL